MDEVVVTNREIYEKCQEILSAVKELNSREIQILTDLNSAISDIKEQLSAIENDLDKIYSGLKTLSDNQVVIDDKLKSLMDALGDVRRKVSNLQVLLPGE